MPDAGLAMNAPARNPAVELIQNESSSASLNTALRGDLAEVPDGHDITDEVANDDEVGSAITSGPAGPSHRACLSLGPTLRHQRPLIQRSS